MCLWVPDELSEHTAGGLKQNLPHGPEMETWFKAADLLMIDDRSRNPSKVFEWRLIWGQFCGRGSNGTVNDDNKQQCFNVTVPQLRLLCAEPLE